MKGIRLGTDPLMHGLVASLSKAVEESDNFACQHASILEADQHVSGLVFICDKYSRAGCRSLRQQFTKLPQLDQSRVGVVEHISLCLCRKPHKQRVVLGEEGKVG